jgi:hypothetical protein
VFVAALAAGAGGCGFSTCVNAGLILSGSHPFPFDNGEGAGKSALPNGGQMITSQVSVSGAGQFGQWKLRVKAFSVSFPQPVFVAAATCR